MESGELTVRPPSFSLHTLMPFEPTAPSKGVALVTGSANGIGRTIAIRLASDGYDIALNDLAVNRHNLDTAREEINKEYPARRVCVLVADVSIEEEVKNMVDGAVDALGRLDVMVANAGILKTGPILQTTVDDLDAVLAVNVRGTFLCYKFAAQKMIDQGTKGRIIGASSLAGKKGHPFLSAYCTSKFAVRGLTQTAATEFGRYGITVNAYAPGLVETAMLDALQKDMVEHTGDQGGVVDSFKKRAAVGYLGNTKDIASLVAYLVSPEAHYVTGQTISIDGGVHFD
ncbi:NAD(P)-binding protein [Imleria badia]|nr:NAD(P)-binding protein [Imleria badia]